jgi:Kef-type K+ transport system membrane component KefB
MSPDGFLAGFSMSQQPLLLIGGILVLAALLGRSVQQRGVSPVIGQIGLGMVLSPYALGWLPASQPLHVLAELGLIFLMIETGLETNWRLLLKSGKLPLKVAVWGVVLPALAGVLFAYGVGQLPLGQCLLIGAALTATSIGITAKTLKELNLLQSPEGSVILGAAIIDDVLGLLLLAGLQLYLQQTTTVAQPPDLKTMALSIGIIGLGLFVGYKVFQPFVKRGLAYLQGLFTQGVAWTVKTMLRFMQFNDGLLQEALALTGFLLLLVSGLHAVSGLSVVLGAFFMGLLLKELAVQHPQWQPINQELETVGSFLIPVVFINIGLSVNWGYFAPWHSSFNPLLLLYSLGLTVLAILTKLLAGLLMTNRQADLSKKPLNGWLIGAGMVPRGEVGLVFVQLGMSLKLLNDFWSSVLIITVCLTTLVTPPLLKQVLARQQ